MIIDGLTRPFDASVELARFICDRHFGVGSDGLIVLKPAKNADFYMDFYNPDGSQSFCGNGSRCAVAFARTLGIQSNHILFQAIDGSHEALFHNSNREISIHMKDVVIPDERRENSRLWDTGSPHYVFRKDEIENLDLIRIAHEIRFSPEFREKGVNINVFNMQNSVVKMRTYERGVENETLSCGTGVTATAIHAATEFNLESPVRIITRGGELSVCFERNQQEYTNVWLQGPAQFVFSGIIAI